jgi:prepilin-type N-terminal cleavage/methylation domain-containing protein
MAGLQNKKITKLKGFSLLELAVVLGIIGVLAAGSVLVFSEQKTHAEWQESQAKLKVIKLAILKFAEVNKYMPCPSIGPSVAGADSRILKNGDIPAVPAIPATPAVPGTGTSPTIPAIPSAGAQPAIPNISVSTCSVDTGLVPYIVLNLSKADVQDSRGNPFIYAVDQGVTDADLMVDCPTQTACFFNKDTMPTLPGGAIYPNPVLPAFNLTTEPLKGELGSNNLQICADSSCSDVQSEGLIAVLLATNDDGFTANSVSDAEVQNLKGEKTYVNQTYSSEPFYDDVLLGISANEIKNSDEGRVFNNVVILPPP